MSEALAECGICHNHVPPGELAVSERETAACADCQVRCVGCLNEWAYDEDDDGSFCHECWDQRSYCSWCDCRFWSDDMNMSGWNGNLYCNSCYDNYRCYECGELSSTAVGDNVCEDCSYSYEMDPEYQENFDYNVESFDVREFAQIRGPMKVSYELEFAGEPEDLAVDLYNAGLSQSPEMAGYSTPLDTAAVKYDGSVDGGGELVGSKFMLPKQSETDRFWRVFEVLRSRVKDGRNALDTRCGLHIHVDASMLPLTTVMSTAVAFNYLEDILYRLAAANWKSHRSLSGNDYAKVAEKDIASKERFRHMFGDRYLGLNLSNYLSNRYSCRCDAGFDRADLCACNKRKMTIEYRLFNTTANHIKMHAYTALACALVSFGKDKELLAADLPPMAFTHTSIDPDDLDNYVERLKWMFEVLPLSAEERESIRYTIRNSELGKLLSNAEPYTDTIRGILEDDADLRIPVFIPVRQDDCVLDVEDVRRTREVPPLTENTPQTRYGDYVYPNPALDSWCEDRNCRTCWSFYSWQERERFEQSRRQSADASVQVQDSVLTWEADTPNPAVPSANDLFDPAPVGCQCYVCQTDRARAAGFLGYMSEDGRWRHDNGRFASNPFRLRYQTVVPMDTTAYWDNYAGSINEALMDEAYDF